MGSSNIRALEIAIEPSYCNMTDGVPSTSGLSFDAVEFIDASQITPVSETMQDVEGGRSGYYTSTPEALITPSGTPVKKGSLTIDFYLRARGGTATMTDGLRALLGTRMALNTKAITSASVTAVATNTITLGSALAAVGDVIACTPESDGPTYYAHVSSVSTNTITVNPPLAGLVANGDTVYVLSDFRLPVRGGDPVAAGSVSPYPTSTPPTVCLRLTGDGWRQICYGCQLTALTITGTGSDSRAVKMTATINVPYATPASATTAYPFPSQSGGRIEHSLAAPLVMSSSFTTAVPTSKLSTYPCVDSWTLTLTWTCEGSTCGNTYVGTAPLEATALECTLDLILGGTALQSTLLAGWLDGSMRGVALGMSANLSEGEGAAIIIPGAIVTDGSVSTVDLGAGYTRTHVVLAPGAYSLDASGTNPMIQLALA